METVGKYTKEEAKEISRAFSCLTQEMESRPYDDLLGVHYQDIASKFSRDNRGEFYTPPAISEMMANICIDTNKIIAEGKPVTIGEPSV